VEKLKHFDIDQEIKLRYKDVLSSLYKTWEKKTYLQLAAGLAKKKKHADLPAEMFTYILDNVSNISLEDDSFYELLQLEGCQEYEIAVLKIIPTAISLLSTFKLPWNHIHKLSSLTYYKLWRNGEIFLGLALAKMLYKNNKKDTKVYLGQYLKWTLRDLRHNDKGLTKEAVSELLEFAQEFKRGDSEYYKEEIKSAEIIFKRLDHVSALDKVAHHVFPYVQQKWHLYYEYENGELFQYAELHDFDFAMEFSRNFKKGIENCLSVIENPDSTELEIFYAEQIMIGIGTAFVNRGTEVKQNKGYISYCFYRDNPYYRASLDKYADKAYKLLANVFVQAFFALDELICEEVYEKGISLYVKLPEQKEKLLKLLRDGFTYNHSFKSLVTSDNAIQYCSLANTVDCMLPELKFFETGDGKKITALAEDIANFENDIGDIKRFGESVVHGKYWFDIEELPDLLEFTYLYPNGSNGDMLKYLFEEHGETWRNTPDEWTGRIAKEKLDILEMFAATVPFITNDINFLELFTKHHIPTIVNGSTHVFYRSIYSSTDEVASIAKVMYEHKLDSKQKRTELYSKLILEKKTTPKWKSEARLYTLVQSLYPDAVYQFRSVWLGMQSLDIYIPSLSLGIEYQGIQHYKPIEHFGGEKHFEYQQANDKKKKKLCKDNGVILLDWSYTEPITAKRVKSFLKNYSSQ